MPGILPSGSANNKGADQLAHRGSLISAFANHKLKSIVFKLAPSEISLFYLVSVSEKADFGMIFSENLKTDFVASMHIYIHINADPIHKPGSCDMHIEGVKPPSRLLVANSVHSQCRRDPYQK